MNSDYQKRLKGFVKTLNKAKQEDRKSEK